VTAENDAACDYYDAPGQTCLTAGMEVIAAEGLCGKCAVRVLYTSLTARERIALAHAVYRLTGYPEPKGEYDLSSVRNPVERAVEDILATRVLPPGEQVDET